MLTRPPGTLSGYFSTLLQRLGQHKPQLKALRRHRPQPAPIRRTLRSIRTSPSCRCLGKFGIYLRQLVLSGRNAPFPTIVISPWTFLDNQHGGDGFINGQAGLSVLDSVKHPIRLREKAFELICGCIFGPSIRILGTGQND